MNKKFVLSVLGYFVVTMIVAVVWHLVLFEEKYQAMGAFTRKEPIMPMGMMAVILQAIIFAYFYPMYYQYKNTHASIKNGVVFSLIMGVNVWTVMVFATGAKILIEPIWDFIFLGTIFQLIQYSFVGITLGLIHRK